MVRTAQEPICDTLARAIAAVDSVLTFEFGPESPDRREFIISADGIRDGFPAVLALAKAAPSLTRWRIIPFRRAHPDFSAISLKDVQVDGKTVEFLPEPDGPKVGLTLSIPGFHRTPDKRYEQAAYLLLDGMIGEYAMETHISFINFVAPAARPPGTWRPVLQLSEVVDTGVPK
jgi:hypothetical protein